MENTITHKESGSSIFKASSLLAGSSPVHGIDSRTTYAIYDDEEVMMDGIRKMKEHNIKVTEVYGPFPVHGLHKLLDMKDTRMAVVSFLFGVTGLSLGLLMTWYMMIADWPVNIGGKPNFSFHENIPAFIPVIFELTVFCAAHGMALTFLLRSGLVPGAKAKNPFPDTTADKFAVEISKETSHSKAEIHEILRSAGVYEIREKE